MLFWVSGIVEDLIKINGLAWSRLLYLQPCVCVFVCVFLLYIGSCLFCVFVLVVLAVIFDSIVFIISLTFFDDLVKRSNV